MTNKDYILDSLADGGEYGECETQIMEFFKFIKVDISIEEIRKLINEMTEEGLVRTNKTWTNKHDETPYALTPKGKEIWEQNNKN